MILFCTRPLKRTGFKKKSWNGWSDTFCIISCLQLSENQHIFAFNTSPMLNSPLEIFETMSLRGKLYENYRKKLFRGRHLLTSLTQGIIDIFITRSNVKVMCRSNLFLWKAIILTTEIEKVEQLKKNDYRMDYVRNRYCTS